MIINLFKKHLKFTWLLLSFCGSSAQAYPPFNQCARCTLKGAKNTYFEQAYEHYRYENIERDTVRIPKIIHQIWLGKPIPAVFKNLTLSWRKQHPDWEYRLWSDQDIGSFPLVTKELIHKATNLGQKSDIFRLEILNRFGGLYVDTDFICLKPHDCFHYANDFYAGMENGVIGNALIGSSPKHPILSRCLQQLSKLRNFNLHTVQRTTGPSFITHMISDYIVHAQDRTVIYPCAYFYPLHCNLRDQIWDHDNNIKAIRPYLKPETHSAHLWAGSWNPKRIAKFVK